jgi:beta-mannosidase
MLTGPATCKQRRASVFRLSLNGTWDLAWCEAGEGERRGWPEIGVAGARRVAATVPGDVHLDLVQAGVIDEPLHGLNAPDCAWMERKDWWHSRTFALEEGQIGERVELVFEGLDAVADVYLNGELVGRSRNAHVPHVFDVTEAVCTGPNLLVVRVDDGIRSTDGKDLLRYSMRGRPEERAWLRKPQFTFGWDWAPRLPTCGIWRGVELRSYRRAALRDVCLRTELRADGSARVRVLADVELFGEEPLEACVAVALRREGEHVAEIQAEVEPGPGTLDGELVVEQPALWWPAPLGEPALYDVEAALSAGGEELDRCGFRYGLREVELVRETIGEEGTSFVIAVNGEKVFCKGADWVPADSIVARVSPAKYDALVGAAAEANFNMLRIWGGGIYEDEVFYESCDERGLLVWQDFPYACSYYPDEDEEFVEEARREAKKAVGRLRNHPCIALWCGNNENQWLHQARKGEGRCLGDRLYDEVLPEVCARLDPSRPYWPSSPYGGEDPNSEMQGNRHAWFVSIGAPTLEERIDYRLYAEDRGKFICEFGGLAPPPLDSLHRYLPGDQLDRDSEAWQFHNNEFEKGTNQEALRRYWRPAEELSLEDYVRWSQTIQAEALKFAVEHWRRRKFDSAGCMFWMYADCWGEVGWTVIDYYLNRKPSYWAVRRAYAPVLVSLKEAEAGVEVWLVNDTREPVTGDLTGGWLNVRTGEMVQESCAAEAPANAAACVQTLPCPGGEREAWMAHARLEGDGAVVSRNRLLLAGFHFNRLGLPEVRLDWQARDGAVEVEADGFAFQVHLDAPRGVLPEDNDFDLMPGERRRVALRGPAGLAERVAVSALNAGQSR